MRKNPYLAHYFGDVMDAVHDIGSEQQDASESFSCFSQSSHMKHRIFRPSNRIEQSDADRAVLCTPPRTAEDIRPPAPLPLRLPVTPPLPPASRPFTPEKAQWGAMLQQSHAAIAQARELLVDAPEPGTPTPPASAERSSLIQLSPSVTHDSPAAPRSPTPPSPSPPPSPPLPTGEWGTDGSNAAAASARPSRRREDAAESKADSTAGTHAMCVVLSTNTNPAGCAAKRLTRRPPMRCATTIATNATTVATTATTAATPAPASTDAEPLPAAPCSSRRSERHRYRRKARDASGDTIPVSSVYGILERIADVVHPRLAVAPADLLATPLPAQAPPSPRALQTGAAVERLARERQALRQRTAPLPFLMGSAQRNETEELDATVPTSQLPEVGVGAHAALPLRAQSARRGSARTLRTPSYALPTESWLCKGSEFADPSAERFP